MCKSFIFMIFEIITKCSFLYSIIQKMMTRVIFYHSKNHVKNIGCKGRYLYVNVVVVQNL
jgi:hypothetical protein